jgi:hypothetical protein
MGGGLLDGRGVLGCWGSCGHDRMRSRYGFAGRAARRNKEMISGFGYVLGYVLLMESHRSHRVAQRKYADVGLLCWKWRWEMM